MYENDPTLSDARSSKQKVNESASQRFVIWSAAVASAGSTRRQSLHVHRDDQIDDGVAGLGLDGRRLDLDPALRRDRTDQIGVELAIGAIVHRDAANP